MEGIFSVDGKAAGAIRTATDLVKLNLVWLLCCIPLVTIGASTTALYSVVIKMVKNEDSYVVPRATCATLSACLKTRFSRLRAR